MKTGFAIVCVLFLLACTTKKKVEATKAKVEVSGDGLTQTDVERGALKYPGYTLADLRSGKSLYEGNCGTCHDLQNPSSRNEQQWKHEVMVMAPKVNSRAGSEVIGAKEQELIVRYLVTIGSARK